MSEQVLVSRNALRQVLELIEIPANGSVRVYFVATNEFRAAYLTLFDALSAALSAPAEAEAGEAAPEIAQMLEVVRQAGPAAWNMTAPMTADEHGAEFARMVRDTQEIHSLDDSPRAVHWLSVKDGLSLAFVGSSPNSPHLARALAGAWNRLASETAALTPPDAPAEAEAGEADPKMEALYRACRSAACNIAEFGQITDGEFIWDLENALAALIPSPAPDDA